jgi:hypothetical protein
VPQDNYCIDSVLKHCAANRKKRLSELPNVSPYIYDVKISGFTRSSIYILYISRLRVNTQQGTKRDKTEVLSSGDERDWEYQNTGEVE